MKPAEEKLLRDNIRSLIKFVKQKRLNEEKELRGIIRSLIGYEMKQLNEVSTPDNDPTPNKSTGINVLEDLLKKIVPVLETDYKLLTTEEEQRISFRSHIVNAVVDTLTPAEANNEAGDEAEESALEEEVDVEIGPGADDEKFIDIRTDAEKADEEEPEDPREDFGIEGTDTTGRNMAYATFKKIETAVIDSYELLSNAEDQELFYDYLIANLKLYFDKFEAELSTSVEEPTNQAYDTAVADMGGEEVAPEGEEELELEI
jgi:hypothetical protein